MSYILCNNGHYYEVSLQECPYCPNKQEDIFNKNTVMQNNDDKTKIMSSEDISEQSKINNFEKTSIFTGNIEQTHQEPISQPTNSRKLVGWLVSFSIDPLGIDFKLREGRNIIGSNSACDVVLQDGQVSGKHLTILYRMGDFKFKDELSTNGTFVNEAFVEEGNLKDGDTIRLGTTIFKFRTAY